NPAVGGGDPSGIPPGCGHPRIRHQNQRDAARGRLAACCSRVGVFAIARRTRDSHAMKPSRLVTAGVLLLVLGGALVWRVRVHLEFGRAVTMLAAGRLEEALASYDHLASERQGNVVATINAGVALYGLK